MLLPQESHVLTQTMAKSPMSSGEVPSASYPPTALFHSEATLPAFIAATNTADSLLDYSSNILNAQDDDKLLYVNVS